MANVLNVAMRVVAPEKSIVPCACAAVTNDSATSAGANARTARCTVSFRAGFDLPMEAPFVEK
jgi:hypothetical protein